MVREIGRSCDTRGRGCGRGRGGHGRGGQRDAAASSSLDPRTRGSNRGITAPPNKKRTLLRWIDNNFLVPSFMTTSVAHFKAHFHAPWYSWEEVPQYVKDGLWEKLMEYFKLPNDTIETEDEVYGIWNESMKGRFRDAMYRARENAKRLAETDEIKDCMDFPPNWMSAETWNKLIDYWSTSNWMKISASANRFAPNQGCGCVVHTGGSIPRTLHEERMTELGRPPMHMELYDWTRERKGSDDYADERSKKVAEMGQMLCHYITGVLSSFGLPASSLLPLPTFGDDDVANDHAPAT